MTVTDADILRRNNVRISGAGETTLIFAHGFGCSQNTWRDVAGAFESAYRVVLFDYVGAGGSDLRAYQRERYNSLDGYAGDVLELCTALDVNNTVLIGHSVSCMISVIAAIKRPEFFSKLVFVAPNPYFFNEGDYCGGLNREDVDGLFEMMDTNYLGWSSLLAPMIMGNADRPELGERLTSSFCSTDPVIAKQFARVTFYTDNRPYLSELTVPSLTLQCANDMLAPASIGKYIYDNTPYNQMIQLKATGHCPHMSAPRDVIKAIENFLQN